MMIIREIKTFIGHFDWYTKSADGHYFVPTEKAPKEAADAMEYVNKLIRRDIEKEMHAI